jgi:hypothetical protein
MCFVRYHTEEELQEHREMRVWLKGFTLEQVRALSLSFLCVLYLCPLFSLLLLKYLFCSCSGAQATPVSHVSTLCLFRYFK